MLLGISETKWSGLGIINQSDSFLLVQSKFAFLNDSFVHLTDKSSKSYSLLLVLRDKLVTFLAAILLRIDFYLRRSFMRIQNENYLRIKSEPLKKRCRNYKSKSRCPFLSSYSLNLLFSLFSQEIRDNAKWIFYVTFQRDIRRPHEKCIPFIVKYEHLFKKSFFLVRVDVRGSATNHC